MKHNGFKKSSDNLCCELCGFKTNNITTLWRHQNICNLGKNKFLNKEIISINDKELVNMLIKQNTQLINILKNNNITNTNLFNNNRTFNIQYPLNGSLKHAINKIDYVDTITLQLSEFEKEHDNEVGYVQGISNLIDRNLKKSDVNQRPLNINERYKHNTNISLGNALKKVSNRNIKLPPLF
jgi:hypothetical protein